MHVKDVVSGATQTLRFSESPVRIGRNQLNDIPIEDPFVSEWHGVIRFDAHGVAFFDMGSTNGALLDGKRIPKNVPAPLTVGSMLVLGRHEVTVSPPLPVAPEPSGAAGGFHKTIGLGQELPALRPPFADGAVSFSSGRRGRPGAALAPALPGAPVIGASLGSAPVVPAPAATAPVEPGPPPAAAEEILTAFCEAFVGLRKGFEQFGVEVGVRTVNGATPLHRARSSEEVLAYLLDPSVDHAAAARELIAIFADFGIHHIAMMEGITEGVRALLQSLDPRAYELGGGGLFSGGKKAKAQLGTYLEHFDQLITDDEQLHGAIFGHEFARAYASVTLGDGTGSGERRRGRDDE
ncbi:MAG TPA: FHA domain-containing protein [Polyangia bacterium]|nr:FHA domain-containing protein [Polyangia bacterium]